MVTRLPRRFWWGKTKFSFACRSAIFFANADTAFWRRGPVKRRKRFSEVENLSRYCFRISTSEVASTGSCSLRGFERIIRRYELSWLRVLREWRKRPAISATDHSFKSRTPTRRWRITSSACWRHSTGGAARGMGAALTSAIPPGVGLAQPASLALGDGGPPPPSSPALLGGTRVLLPTALWQVAHDSFGTCLA